MNNMNTIKILVPFMAIFCAVSSFEDKTIYEWLVDNGYTELTSRLHQTGLDVVLSHPGAHTILAPTNAAFQSLSTPLPTDTTELQKILQYHIMNEYLLIPLIQGFKEHKALDGHNLQLHESHGSAMVNNGTHIVAPFDVITNNGVIQTIDDVLFPPAAAGGNLNLAQLLIRHEDRYREFALFMMLTGLLQPLEAGEYTLLCPINEAFALIARQLVNPQAGGPRISQDQYIRIAKYYIIPGKRTTANLRNVNRLYTLEGYPVNVTSDATGQITFDGYSKVIKADVMATNGVLHVIDNLLSPDDVQEELIAQMTHTTPSRAG